MTEPLNNSVRDCQAVSAAHQGSKPMAPPTGGAARNKRYRSRRATGIVVLTLPAREYELVEALLSTDRLTVAEALDRRRVAHAAAQVLDDFARRWAQKRDA